MELCNLPLDIFRCIFRYLQTEDLANLNATFDSRMQSIISSRNLVSCKISISPRKGPNGPTKLLYKSIVEIQTLKLISFYTSAVIKGLNPLELKIESSHSLEASDAFFGHPQALDLLRDAPRLETLSIRPFSNLLPTGNLTFPPTLTRFHTASPFPALVPLLPTTLIKISLGPIVEFPLLQTVFQRFTRLEALTADSIPIPSILEQKQAKERATTLATIDSRLAFTTAPASLTSLGRVECDSSSAFFGPLFENCSLLKLLWNELPNRHIDEERRFPSSLTSLAVMACPDRPQKGNYLPPNLTELRSDDSWDIAEAALRLDSLRILSYSTWPFPTASYLHHMPRHRASRATQLGGARLSSYWALGLKMPLVRSELLGDAATTTYCMLDHYNRTHPTSES